MEFHLVRILSQNITIAMRQLRTVFASRYLKKNHLRQNPRHKTNQHGHTKPKENPKKTQTLKFDNKSQKHVAQARGNSKTLSIIEKSRKRKTEAPAKHANIRTCHLQRKEYLPYVCFFLVSLPSANQSGLTSRVHALQERCGVRLIADRTRLSCV